MSEETKMILEKLDSMNEKLDSISGRLDRLEPDIRDIRIWVIAEGGRSAHSQKPYGSENEVLAFRLDTLENEVGRLKEHCGLS